MKAMILSVLLVAGLFCGGCVPEDGTGPYAGRQWESAAGAIVDVARPYSRLPRGQFEQRGRALTGLGVLIDMARQNR